MPYYFSIGMNAVLFGEWQLFKGVWGRFIRTWNVRAIGEINVLGLGRIEVTPVEIRTAIPLRRHVQLWKQEASVL